MLIGVSGGQIAGGGAGRHGARAGSIFALANPTPEVHPDVAARYAAVVATGRSDFPNQINNVLAFPGIFRGALDARRDPDHRGMKMAAAEAIAAVVADGLRRTRSCRPAGPAGRPGGRGGGRRRGRAATAVAAAR